MNAIWEVCVTAYGMIRQISILVRDLRYWLGVKPVLNLKTFAKYFSSAKPKCAAIDLIGCRDFCKADLSIEKIRMGCCTVVFLAVDNKVALSGEGGLPCVVM